MATSETHTVIVDVAMKVEGRVTRKDARQWVESTLLKATYGLPSAKIVKLRARKADMD